MIKLILFDLDGVLTNGNIYVDYQGREHKQINLRDIDAISEIKRSGFCVGVITGENTEIVEYFKNRIKWDLFYMGCKSKVAAIKEIQFENNFEKREIAYVGDSYYDIEPLAYVEHSFCFNDAIRRVKNVCKHVIDMPSGCGGVWEILDTINSLNSKNSEHL